MKTSTRRVGIVGLSTIVATSMMTLSGAPSFAAVGDYAALSAPAIAAGTASQAAGNVTLEFANSWTTGASQTFTVGANNCSTAAGITAAVSFSALPTVAVTDPAPANGADTTPTFAPPVALSSSSTACGLLGINDTFTITQVAPSTGGATDNWLVTLSNVKYTTGATAAKGNINLATAGAFKASGSVVNAIIPSAGFTNTPARSAALPSATGVSLGSQNFNETTVGAFFPTGSTTVTLTLGGGTFTNGVTPTITVPAGYTATHPATTGTAATYQFVVTAPATVVAATVTVSGLTAEVGSAVGVRTLTASGMAIPAPALKVLNVVNYGARTGGATRYDTAAALFNGEFGNVSTVVLASGANFPDALSANYLAGRVITGGTGTLLTDPNNLSDAARFAIFGHAVSTVYITGGTAAVSQNVQNQIEALRVGNNPASALIKTVRLGGANRYDTNVLVNSNNFAGHVPTVLLASGRFFPDALALGPVAARLHMPLITTDGTVLGSQETAQLNAFTPTNVVIAGGVNVVSKAIEDSLKTQGYTVLRLAGDDRTQTAAAVATWATEGAGATPGTPPAITAAQGFLSNTTYISTGANFADALAAGPVAGHNNHMIVLSGDVNTLGAGIPSYLGGKAVGTGGTVAGVKEVDTLSALGLTAAVSSSVMQAAAVTIGTP